MTKVLYKSHIKISGNLFYSKKGVYVVLEMQKYHFKMKPNLTKMVFVENLGHNESWWPRVNYNNKETSGVII